MPIQILKHLEPVIVQEGSPAALHCELTAGPYDEAVIVSWSKDDVIVDKDPNYSFSFSNNVARCFISECFPEDSGTWTCSFRYPDGDSRDVVASSTMLTCKEAAIVQLISRSHEGAAPDPVAPEFVNKLVPQRLVEGGHALFQCIVAGFPPPDVQWLKNGDVIHSGYRYQVQNEPRSGNCSLSISFILPDEDAGIYSCVATNVKGQAITEAPLLDDDAYKRFLAEDQKRLFVGELSHKVRARSPAMFRKHEQRKDVYIPKYEIQLLKNVSRRLERNPAEDTEDSGPKLYPGAPPLKPTNQHAVYIPKYEIQLLKNVSRRLEDISSPEDTEESGPKLYPGAPPLKPTNQHFIVTIFEERLLNEIEFRDDKLRNSYPNSGDNDLDEPAPPESETVPPTFAVQPESQQLIEGATVRFECVLYGNPTPRFNWFHNGRPLYPSQRVNLSRTLRDPQTGTTKAVLTLSRVYHEDTGFYTVLAWNSRGRATCSSQLYVDKVGIVDEQPDFTRSVAFQMLEARNKKMDGPKVKAGVVEKHLAPCFMKKPGDVYAKEGKTARFDCKVAGRPTPTLTWYHEGLEVPVSDPNRSTTVREDGTNSLLFHDVKLRDAGHYECVASNKGGEARFIVRLVVDESSIEQAPRIIEKPPSNIPCREGEPVFLRVRAIGNPEPVLTFVKDGVKRDPYAPEPEERPVVDKVSPGVFEISFPGGVNKDDNGWYTCAVRSPAGSDSFSCKINMKIDKPQDVKPNPVKIYIPKRGTYPVPPLAPPEEKPIPLKLNIPKRGTHPLPPPPGPETQPSYVKKDAWDDNELFASSKPHEAPRFKKLLQDISIPEGNKTYMECTVYPAGDPTMVIEWFKDGRPLLHGTRMRPIFEFGFCVLEFDDVWPRDTGLYVCRATNKVGMAEVSCRVSVKSGQSLVVEESQLPAEMRAGFEQLTEWERLKSMTGGPANEEEEMGPPIIVQYPEQMEVIEGNTAKFLCRVTGNPVPTVFWYRNEQILSSNNRTNVWYDGIHHLELSKARATESGTITLIARNQFGEARFDTLLIVKKKANQVNKVTHKAESVVMKKFASNSVTTTVNTETNVTSTYPAPANGHVQTGIQL